MPSSSARVSTPLTTFEQLQYARSIIQLEAHALNQVAARLDTTLCQATDLLFDCEGSVVVTGMGKAGLIGQKIAATLASTGTPSHFLHPAEAVHGDLGQIHRRDVVLVLSQSGETEEVVRLLPSLEQFGTPTIAITRNTGSTLGRTATVTIALGPLSEACSLGLAPSTSTTAMLAVGDALALVTSRMRGFGREDFARFHPGGSLGRELSKVDDQMRALDECRVALHTAPLRDVLVLGKEVGRRSGAIMIVDDDGILCGIFTDSDLARLFAQRSEQALDGPIRNVMTPHPCVVRQGAMLADAVQVLAERKISELPVVRPDGTPCGMIDITDVVSMLPDEAA
ncbi:MAG: KpsF/GutQ family sugar-phosphate isomerase [Planctomycetales bacterium]|nr:KpsF/GutQ family sugar-phosphate isomerase [Planctomycetales bacterium]